MAASDIIYLYGLKISAYIGIYQWEQQVQQPILLDIEMNFDISRAARSLDINDSINYAKVAAQLAELALSKKFLLLETLVEEIADLLLAQYKIAKVKIRGNKVAAVPKVVEVGVIVERVATK